MNIVKTPVDIKTLIQTSTIDIYNKTKLVEKLQQHFSEEEQRHYVCNLFLYLNYHPTDDFIVNLENVWKFIGFSNKANANRLLKHNFKEKIDYKKLLIRTDEQVPNIKDGKNIGGAGQNKETIMLNINTFKKLCLKANTENADKIHDYYIKLEMIYNELMKEELENKDKLLEEQEQLLKEKDNKLQLTLLESQERQDKINVLTKKTNKFKPGESVYIFRSSYDNKNIYKVGRSKNCNEREYNHKTATFDGEIIHQVMCSNSTVLEKVCHYILDKYKLAIRREWFNADYNIIKNGVEYAQLMLDSTIDFENTNLINETTDFIESIKHSTNLNNNNTNDEPVVNDIFTTLKFIPNDINNFETFINENCEKDIESTISHITIKNQYKIWAKTANHSQLKKLIDYLKIDYTTSMKKYNPLVSTSKLTQHFNGLKLKNSLFVFEKPIMNNYIIERFLYEKCQRGPGYRITMQECFLEFENWYITGKFTHIIKEKLKNYLDIEFIRLRTDDESNGVDNRLGGWLGFALKTNNIPEPIKKYKPKNAKIIIQKNANTNEIIKEWSSVSELSEYIHKSRTFTSALINRNEQIYIDNILCILYKK